MTHNLICLPFNNLNDNELNAEFNNHHLLPFSYFDNLIFNNSNFLSTNERINDPDYNLFNDCKPSISNYYTVDEWHSVCVQNSSKLRMLFCNIASMKTNFDNFVTSYLTSKESFP